MKFNKMFWYLISNHNRNRLFCVPNDIYNINTNLTFSGPSW